MSLFLLTEYFSLLPPWWEMKKESIYCSVENLRWTIGSFWSGLARKKVLITTASCTFITKAAISNHSLHATKKAVFFQQTKIWVTVTSFTREKKALSQSNFLQIETACLQVAVIKGVGKTTKISHRPLPVMVPERWFCLRHCGTDAKT